MLMATITITHDVDRRKSPARTRLVYLRGLARPPVGVVPAAARTGWVYPAPAAAHRPQGLIARGTATTRSEASRPGVEAANLAQAGT
jgi:hypothetical protein